jgi:hypothetical protein
MNQQLHNQKLAQSLCLINKAGMKSISLILAKNLFNRDRKKNSFFYGEEILYI